MNNHLQFDYIIIGQGLAGSLLAWQLLQLRQRILVIDSTEKNTASRIAAGIINPVTGLKLAKMALAESYLSEANSLYSTLENYFATTFFQSRNMLRIFKSIDEKQLFESRLKDPAFRPFLKTVHPAHHFSCLSDDFGSGSQLCTGYVNSPLLLDKMIEFLKENNAYLTKSVERSTIKQNSNGVMIDHYSAKTVIFCEGYQASTNPWFKWLPFAPVKGEILNASIRTPLSNHIINSGNWLLPTLNTDTHTQFRFGATYEREKLSTLPTRQGQETLVKAIRCIIRDGSNAKIKIRAHLAGIRPCTRDRMPFIGLHPQNPKLAIFNGFGSKGALLIPYYASLFARHLVFAESIPKNCHINRYWDE